MFTPEDESTKDGYTPYVERIGGKNIITPESTPTMQTFEEDEQVLFEEFVIGISEEMLEKKRIITKKPSEDSMLPLDPLVSEPKKTSSMLVHYGREAKVQLEKLPALGALNTRDSIGPYVPDDDDFKYRLNISPSMHVLISETSLESFEYENVTVCTCDVGCQTIDCPDECTQTEAVQ